MRDNLCKIIKSVKAIFDSLIRFFESLPRFVEPARTVLVHVQGVRQVLVSERHPDIVLLEHLLPDGQRLFVHLDALLDRIEIQQIESVIQQRVREVRMTVHFVHFGRHIDGLRDQ